LFVIYNFSPIVVVTHAETGKHRGGHDSQPHQSA
jgi:hypothetical protein